MAIIHIDGQDVEVDGADNLLQACLSLGIDIPYFCYHPALGSVGSCRQCAVKQYNNKEDYEAGRGRLVMSCMVNPTPDMWISVTDAEVKNFRKSLVEFLMTNHPHDCPPVKRAVIVTCKILPTCQVTIIVNTALLNVPTKTKTWVHLSIMR